MRTGFVSAVLALLAGVGLARAQPAEPLTLPPSTPSSEVVPPDLALAPELTDGTLDFSVDPVTNGFWVGGSYLHWWLKDRGLPPLITKGSASDPIPGALGQPGTVILFGGSFAETEAHPGARLTGGLCLNAARTIAIETDILFLPRHSLRPAGLALPGPVLARPYIDITTGSEAAAVISSPDLTGGFVTASLGSQLFGAELNLRGGVYRDDHWTVHVLGGFRYLRFVEDIDIDESIPVVGGVPVFGTDHLTVNDHFGTSNEFFGGQVGVQVEFSYQQLILGLRGKVAVGTTRETIDIHGVTAPVNIAGPAASPPPIPSGVLALTTNSGIFGRDRFTAVPEFGLNVGWRITERLRLDVGYTLLWWTSVARAADQIDRTLNPTQIPTSFGLGTLTGAARPVFLFEESSFWVQGLTFSLEFRF